MPKQGYYVEWNGDCWQSVFPAHQAHLSNLHETPEDAASYIEECAGPVFVETLPRPFVNGRTP